MAWKISDLHMGCDSWRSIEPGDVWFPGYPMAFHQQPTPDSALPDPTLDHHKVKAGGWGTLENHHSSYSMIPNMVKHGKNGTNKQIIIRYWVDSAIDNRTYENSCLLGTETWPSNVIRIRSVTSDAHHLQYPYDAPISMEKIQQNPNEIHGVRPDSAECMPRSAPGLSPHCDSAALSAWPRWKYWAWPLDLWGWVWIGSEGLPQHGKFFLGSSTQTHLDHLKHAKKPGTKYSLSDLTIEFFIEKAYEHRHSILHQCQLKRWKCGLEDIEVTSSAVTDIDPLSSA